jgi:hypothetical protein
MELHFTYKVQEIIQGNELSGSGIVWCNLIMLTNVVLCHNYYNCTWATGFMNTAIMFYNSDDMKVQQEVILNKLYREKGLWKGGSHLLPLDTGRNLRNA